MQQLYVAELSDNGIEVLHEVSQEELDEDIISKFQGIS